MPIVGDGRWLYYDYDQYGDLITVTLPDNTARSYTYQHATQTVTNGTATYSTHLIIEEDKPDGRVLQNLYDSQPAGRPTSCPPPEQT